MYISEDNARKILSITEDRLIDTISSFSQLRRSGAGYTTACPCCSSEQGLSITPAKKIFKCFRCGECAGKRPIDYLMSGHNMSYPEALKWLADHFGILIDEPLRQPKPSSKKGKKESFCSRMLKDSGLTKEDVTATICNGSDTRTIFKQPTFVKGTLSESGQIDPEGDDVIIHYYDLEGYPITYIQKDSRGKAIGGPKEFYRIRYQFPEEHTDKNGRPSKYRSPYGSQSRIYIPQYIRTQYKNALSISRLYIQEGEKKAEKACKHGLPSVAVAGIQNLGINKQLPECIIKIIETCQVKEVVFMLDSDCFDLTTHLKLNDPVDRRPRNFFNAVKNFKEYFEILKNRNLYLEIYFGHVLKNPAGDKGVDDLLSRTLKGREDDLKKDIDTAINLKEKKGEYIQLYKLTTISDAKIQEIWGLQNAKEFCKRYEELLRDLPEFYFGRHKWRFNEKGELEPARALEPDEQFWEEHRRKDASGGVKVEYSFKYVPAIRFLNHRGFGKYPKLDGSFEFIHITHPTVTTVNHSEIGDYFRSFVADTLKEPILEMIYKGGYQFLGPQRLEYLNNLSPAWEVPQRGLQYMYFAENYWEITAEGVKQHTYDQIPHNIWADQKKEFNASLLQELFRVEKDEDGRYTCTLTSLGRKCHFLCFLANASNFTWRKRPEEVSADETAENVQHLVAKLCALGYLVLSVKDYSAAKAVIGVDGKQSEIGVSNGRSGKSLLGELLRRTVVTQYINGKTVDLARDQFVWTELTEKTKIVFIDDVKKDFNFELLFANVTGSWNINYKSGGRITLDFARSPKVYLTTNHAISGDGTSFLDRQWSIAFSDFYNDEHKPINDFKMLFFEEWDYEQWNLTWNLIAQCVRLYFKLGVVESPGERIEIRRLRQDLGEEFILWADEYFSADEHRNIRISRKDMYDHLIGSVGPARVKFYTPTIFKKKIIKYCQFKDYLFNPHRLDPVTGQAVKLDKDGRPDIDDKTGGVEYFVVGDANYYSIAAEQGTDIFSDEIDMIENE